MFNPLYGLTGAPVSSPEYFGPLRPQQGQTPYQPQQASFQPQVQGWTNGVPVAQVSQQAHQGFARAGATPWQSQWNSPLAQLYQGGRSSLYRRTW